MARRTISLDEKIEKAEAAVLAAKTRYDKAPDELEKLVAKRKQMEDKRILEAYHESDKTADEVKEVSDILWADVGIIDDYLRDVDGISDRDRELITGWKRCVSGRFILERILKKGAILISAEDEEAYQVSGIVSTWDEMFGYAHLPLMIHTTLIPFEDVIISDGLVQTYNVIIGGNMAMAFKDIYMTAKKSGALYRKL